MPQVTSSHEGDTCRLGEVILCRLVICFSIDEYSVPSLFALNQGMSFAIKFTFTFSMKVGTSLDSRDHRALDIQLTLLYSQLSISSNLQRFQQSLARIGNRLVRDIESLLRLTKHEYGAPAYGI